LIFKPAKRAIVVLYAKGYIRLNGVSYLNCSLSQYCEKFCGLAFKKCGEGITAFIFVK
jgi:hypothetical protein